MDDSDGTGGQTTVVLTHVGNAWRRLKFTIYIDGRAVGVIADGLPRLVNVTPGAHHVTVKDRLIRSRHEIFHFAEGERLALEFGSAAWAYLPIWLIAMTAMLSFIVSSKIIEFSIIQFTVSFLWSWALFAIPGLSYFVRPAKTPIDSVLNLRPIDPPNAKALANPIGCKGNGVSLRSLVALVAVCALITVAGRDFWDLRSSNLPARTLRNLHSTRESDRKEALHFISYVMSTTKLPTEDENRAVSMILLALKDENTEIRMEALNAIRSLQLHFHAKMPRFPEITLGLAEALEDSVPKIRKESASTLFMLSAGSFGKGKPNPPLPVEIDRFLDLLSHGFDDPNPEIRNHVALTLREIGPQVNRAVPKAVLAALHADDSAKRKDAIETVLTFPQSLEESLPELLHLMEHDSNPTLRDLCSQRLWHVKFSPKVIPIFERGLKSPERLVRYRSADKLRGIGAPAKSSVSLLLPLLSESFDQVTPREKESPEYTDPAVAACLALADLAPGTEHVEEVKRTLQALLQRDERPWRRKNAANALSRIEEKTKTKKTATGAK